MQDIEIVRGKKAWKKEFADFAVLSAPDYYPALMGPKVKRALQYVYLKEDSLFCYRNSYFANYKGELAGQITVYDHEYGVGSTPRMVKYYLTALGKDALTHGVYLMRANSKMARTSEGQTYSCNLGVRPELRGRGIGTRIFEAVLSDAKERGRTAVTLDVESWNKRTIDLYKRMGFKFDGKGFCVRVGDKDIGFYRMAHGLSGY